MNSNRFNRDIRIDILRFIAIISIIFVHSGPGDLLFQIRNFDVVLMVLLLGASFYISSLNKKLNYFDYVKKRFNRLVIPTWTFLTIFFGIFYLLSLINHEPFYFSYNEVVESYTLATIGEGIGFVWIMRIFFIIALVCPFLLRLSRQIKDNMIYIFLITIAYLFYEVLLLTEEYVHSVFRYSKATKAGLIYSSVIINSFAYILIAALGVRLVKLRRKEIILYCLASLIVLLFLAFKYNFTPTQQFKYPPRLYYISYGVFVSLLLYSFLELKRLRYLFDNSFVMFVSKTSAWLYFWHIISFYVVKIYGPSFPIVSGNLVGRFLFIFTTALVVTYLHEQIKKTYRHSKLSPIVVTVSDGLQNNRST
ncbi:acyltransferase [Pontibacter silvestris]|uniref:Acyltransferase n=1 Tax=Pontibacter silvestris TaxID=2305183 RepID=A0ABW4WZ46_9BACT